MPIGISMKTYQNRSEWASRSRWLRQPSATPVILLKQQGGYQILLDRDALPLGHPFRDLAAALNTIFDREWLVVELRKS